MELLAQHILLTASLQDVSVLFVFGLVIAFGAMVLVQTLLVWAVAKVINAPNDSFQDAFKLSTFLSLISLAVYGGFLCIEKYYEPQAITSSWWAVIVIGFCAQIIASFSLTMNILGIGLIRAIVMGLLTNALWKVLAMLAPDLLGN